MSHETFVPTVMLSYINVDGKLLLHQLYVSDLGSTDWRKVPIRSNGAKGEPLYRDKMGHPVYATRAETVVFGQEPTDWSDWADVERPPRRALPGED